MHEVVKYIESLTPDQHFMPRYDVSNGVTAWKFSDLFRRRGYKDAVWWVELVRDRVPGIPLDCRLLESYNHFLKVKNDNDQ